MAKATGRHNGGIHGRERRAPAGATRPVVPASELGRSAAPPIARPALHDEAAVRIRDMIAEGQLAPGSKIAERELCEAFGISRTPLREALKVLAREGMLVLLPHRGARVAELTDEDTADIFRVMGVLEGLAGELACENIGEAALAGIRALHSEMLAHFNRGDRPSYFRANQAIHDAIFAATGNAVLCRIYEGLRGRVRHARYMANVTLRRWEEAVREHGEILDALERRDGPRLRDLLQRHLTNKYRALVASEADANAGARGR